MYKSFILLLSLAFIFPSADSFCQRPNSFQINGGIIFPVGASDGASFSFQYGYSVSNKVELYVMAGYSSWDRNRVVFQEEWSVIQKQQYFDSYSADNHKLIPVFLGCKLDLYKNRLFSMYGLAELGYAHVSYDAYNNIKSVDPSTGAVLAYNPDPASRTNETEDLLGAGVGVGVFRPITDNLFVNLAFKFDILGNSHYNAVLSTGKTYTSLLLGLEYNL